MRSTKNALNKNSHNAGFYCDNSVLRSFTRSGTFRYNLYMYFVYILQSQKDKSYYTGFTENLENRVRDHNWHEATYSKSKAPFDLVWYCSFRNKRMALDFEKYLKQGSGFAFARKRLV